MRSVKFLLQKEFLQIFRNKIMLPIIFVMPLFQLLILSFAANYEVKHLSVHFIDHDLSSYSRKLFSKFQASDNFNITNSSFSYAKGLEDLEADKADLIIEIPKGFERELIKYNQASILIAANAINGTKAGLGVNYASSMIRDFNAQIRLGMTEANQNQSSLIGITYANWYNPHLNYKNFMVPGILVVLVTMIGAFLSGMNIVREKEIGTIEQLNVTPIKKHHFIIGKLLPFWIVGILELAIGLTFAKLVFNIPFEGSIALIFSFAALYLLVVLGIGLFISTFTETQQQAMFIAWFFIVIFILMSGLFTPVENMPDWAQTIAWLNPIKYFIEVMRQVMLKGSGFLQIKAQFLVILLMAVIINALAIWNYRKTS